MKKSLPKRGRGSPQPGGFANWAGVKRLLVPVDFSEPSIATVRYAAAMALDSGAALMLLHVVPVDYGLLGIGQEDSRDFETALQRQASHQLQALARKHVAKKVPLELQVRIGRPPEEIVSSAAESKSDLIIVSTHGLTGLDRYLIGSVTEKVVRLAAIPVLVLRGGKRSAAEKKKERVLRVKR